MVRSGWHWRCHWQWTPITFETMVWGRGREPGWLRSLVPPSPVMPPALGRLSGCLLVIRTIVSEHIFWRGSSLGIKLKRLLGQWIHRGTSWSSCLYSIIWYSLGQWPFCPLVLSLGWEWGRPIFLPMSPAPVRRNAASLASSTLRPSPLNVSHRKVLPYLGWSLLPQ